jgi:hypothetical protein
MFKNELSHKIHEIHQQNIKNLRINKTKFPLKTTFYMVTKQIQISEIEK